LPFLDWYLIDISDHRELRPITSLNQPMFPMTTFAKVRAVSPMKSPELQQDWRKRPWTGVYAATLCAFRDDESLDEEGLSHYIRGLVEVNGIQGVVCNGHTGEVMSLRPQERFRVVEVVANAARSAARDVKVVSGVSAEGSLEAIDHAIAAREAGADAILLMPPHHWLRFGRSSRTAVGFIQDVADAAGIDVILHQYPSWTKAGYSLAEMQEMLRHPRIVMIKMGTRDMSRWLYDYEKLKEIKPDVSIVTCHDEFLLPTLLEGADGALVGFAGFAPKLIVRMVSAALDGDLAKAKAAQQHVAPLARLIYAFGEPGCGAHQRMKVARWLMGQFPSPHFRRPVRPLPTEEIDKIRTKLKEIGYDEL
jgi:4-hydroxy-tetrahydrodipicolinate synthase